MKIKLAGLAILLALIGFPPGRADAAIVTYTFAGTGAGTAGGDAFSGAFSFILTSDTSLIDSSGAPFIRLDGISSGTFTAGSFSASLTQPVTIVATEDPVDRINLFNNTFDNGVGFSDASFASYQLNTSLGPVTAGSGTLLPTFNPDGHGFATNGGLVEITELDSLTFQSAIAAVPEPSTWAMMLIGIMAIGIAGYRPARRSTITA